MMYLLVLYLQSDNTNTDSDKETVVFVDIFR